MYIYMAMHIHVPRIRVPHTSFISAGVGTNTRQPERFVVGAKYLVTPTSVACARIDPNVQQAAVPSVGTRSQQGTGYMDPPLGALGYVRLTPMSAGPAPSASFLRPQR